MLPFLLSRLFWPSSVFPPIESQADFGDYATNHLFNFFFLDRFVSKITLYIPNLGNIECTGDPRSDKKSSLDSAALVMLYDLERQGKIIIGG